MDSKTKSSTDLSHEFQNPSRMYRGKPFWAWNSRLEEEELRRQIRIFKDMGFGGAFLHSRVGLETEYLGKEWFDLTRACIDESQKTDMEAWLYDEDRWPSGPAGGLVTKDPRWQAKMLDVRRMDTLDDFTWPKDKKHAWVFAARMNGRFLVEYAQIHGEKDLRKHPGRTLLVFEMRNWPCMSWFNGYTYLDTLGREAVDEFIRVTHDRYKQEVGEFFGSVVPGIFTDEPHHGPVFRRFWDFGRSLPWTPDLPNFFRRHFGYDLTANLPELFYDFEDARPLKARYDFHDCKTRMFVEHFAGRIGAWCEDNNLLFTGHVLEEDPVSAMVSVDGSAMQFYAKMNAPGIDLLGRYRHEYLAAKQCVSVARQMDRRWVLSELYGCTGWETTFETYKDIGDWQAVLGITLRCPHLSWYSMAGEAKRDYPASIHFHSPWWRQYKALEDYYSRMNVLMTEGAAVCDLAVIHPWQTYTLYLYQDIIPESGGTYAPLQDERLKKMDEKYDTLVRDLLESHLDFDFLDEHLMRDLKTRVVQSPDGPLLEMGHMKYKAVLVPDLHTLHESTCTLLKEFISAGGIVVFAGHVPHLVEARPSETPKALAEGRTTAFQKDAIIKALEAARRVSIADDTGREIGDIFYQLRKRGDDYTLLLVNRSRREPHTAKVRICPGKHTLKQVQLWNAFTGQVFEQPAEITENDISFSVDLSATGSALLVLSSEARQIESVKSYTEAGDGTELNPGPWDYLLDDYTPLVLDRASCRAECEGRPAFEADAVEILELDARLRDWLELERRGGFMIQPWLKKNEPLGPLAGLRLIYEFDIDVLPKGPLLLAAEQLERWSVAVNGRGIDTQNISGWWVDPAVKTVLLNPGVLKTGRNVLILNGTFDRLANLESIFILGRFGVHLEGTAARITAAPETLTLGPWKQQGLPFYSGNVTYRTDLTSPPADDRRVYIHIGGHYAAAVEIALNSQVAGLLTHGNYELDITDFLTDDTNDLRITLLGSRRNAFGPFHMNKDELVFTGPDAFVRSSERWQDEIRVLDYGLYETPRIIYKKRT